MSISNALVQDKSFRGRPYKIAYVTRMDWDPSWFSFEDESAVRDELWTVGEGDVVFDIGAAYGSYTLTALAMGAARVFAWSPQAHPGAPDAEADFMLESLGLNGWANRVQIYRDGLFDKTGWLDTRPQEFLTIQQALLDDGRFANNDIVAVRTLNDWCAKEFDGKYAPPVAGAKTWMKLDVEGAEVAILQTSVGFISEHMPNVMVENHNFKDPTIEPRIRAFMTSLGYREVVTRPYGAISHSLYVP